MLFYKFYWIGCISKISNFLLRSDYIKLKSAITKKMTAYRYLSLVELKIHNTRIFVLNFFWNTQNFGKLLGIRKEKINIGL